MKLIIKEYRPQDLDSVIRLNRLITKKWNHYSYENGVFVKGRQANPEDLSNFEQWYHGGPWNNLEVFPLYTEIVYKSGGTIILAWEGDTLVGEVDCCQADNFGNSGYILWILTHPDKRKNGIGQLLIKKCVEFFKQKGITRILVSPEDENAANFYYHVGFTDFTKGLCIEFCQSSHQQWIEIQNELDITHPEISDLNHLRLPNMYPLFGSTRSDNYTVQTALNREKIIYILGNTVEESFLPKLWKYTKENCIAIFGCVYQIRAWVNENALENSEFIADLSQLIISLHKDRYKDENVNVFVLERDIEKLNGITHRLISTEYVLSLKI